MRRNQEVKVDTNIYEIGDIVYYAGEMYKYLNLCQGEIINKYYIFNRCWYRVWFKDVNIKKSLTDDLLRKELTNENNQTILPNTITS
jgi:hypothetical protein